MMRFVILGLLLFLGACDTAEDLVDVFETEIDGTWTGTADLNYRLEVTSQGLSVSGQAWRYAAGEGMGQSITASGTYDQVARALDLNLGGTSDITYTATMSVDGETLDGVLRFSAENTEQNLRLTRQ